MKILIDMNLSPDWTAVLEAENIEAVHWSSVGKPNAPGKEIMQFARENDFIVFTRDLDFGAMLALTQAESPSVLQVRSRYSAEKHRKYCHYDSAKIRSRTRTSRVDCIR